MLIYIGYIILYTRKKCIDSQNAHSLDRNRHVHTIYY